MTVTISLPDGAGDDLRRLGILDADELADLQDGLREARLDAEEGERRLSRPVAPGRAAKRKQRRLYALAEIEHTLLQAERRVLEERLARLEADREGDPGDRSRPPADEEDAEGVPRPRLYKTTDGWLGR